MTKKAPNRTATRKQAPEARSQVAQPDPSEPIWNALVAEQGDLTGGWTPSLPSEFGLYEMLIRHGFIPALS